MPPIDEPSYFEQTSPESAERRQKTRSTAAPGQAPDGELIAFIIDTATGRVVKAEGADASGARRELTNDEKSRLLAKTSEETLEGFVEKAFEAGLECVLGREREDEVALESELDDEDVELRRLLLRSLITRTAAKRLMQREALSRAIAGTLIKQAVGAESSLAH
jgi:hypothetical protein